MKASHRFKPCARHKTRGRCKKGPMPNLAEGAALHAGEETPPKWVSPRLG
jgi:hypothetical protein